MAGTCLFDVSIGSACACWKGCTCQMGLLLVALYPFLGESRVGGTIIVRKVRIDDQVARPIDNNAVHFDFS
jgi:hypothetical protein